ncbi:MAG: methyltransferase domain-containing protein [Mycobacteriales bacterium]
MNSGDRLTAEEGDLYCRFLEAVVTRQIGQWMPGGPARVLDLSSEATASRAMRAGGLQVKRAPEDLSELPTASVDAVVAEGLIGALSLAAELTFEAAERLLRPGGRLLVRVESHLAGLGELAGQGRWAELADLPGAEVLLVPDRANGVRRCFWPEELSEALSGAGLEVEWVRPRTVLIPEAVGALLEAEPDRFNELVATELSLEAQREGEAIGHFLVASAVKGGGWR